MVGGQRTALRATGAGRDEYSRHPPADRSVWPGRVLIPTYPPKPLKRGGACVRFYRLAGMRRQCASGAAIYGNGVNQRAGRAETGC